MVGLVGQDRVEEEQGRVREGQGTDLWAVYAIVYF